jgi:hypothetical protein
MHGKAAWKVVIKQRLPLDALACIFSSQLIVNGIVYFTSTDGYLHAFE